MLLRILAASSTLRKSRQLGALLPADGICLVPLEHDQSLWEALRSQPFDVVAIDEDLIEGAPESFISDVRALPEAPEVVVFVALINNTMTMQAVSIYWQMIVIGGVLVSAVALDMLIRAKRD